MNFKKLILLMVFIVTLYPSTVFAYPGKTEQRKFIQYFCEICLQHKQSTEADEIKYSNKFD